MKRTLPLTVPLFLYLTLGTVTMSVTAEPYTFYAALTWYLSWASFITGFLALLGLLHLVISRKPQEVHRHRVVGK